MPKHRLTVVEQLRGVRKAIDSPRTPVQLRKGLQDRLTVLQRRLERDQSRRVPRRRSKPVSLFDWLGL